MKDLGLMHYFLGLAVWQRLDEIFLSQGKYTVDVLRRFGMMDCKSMATPMVSNLKKLHEIASRLDLVDSIATLKHTVLQRGSFATLPKRCSVERRHKVLQRGSCILNVKGQG